MKELISRIEHIESEDFETLALDVFRWQAQHLPIYNTYLKHLHIDTSSISCIEKIPFLPITFFKSEIINSQQDFQTIFKSSGTTGIQRSQHFVHDLSLYEAAICLGFEEAFGNIKDYCFLALLPNYIEQGDSSLVYMVDFLMKKSQHPDNGFYLHDHQALAEKLHQLKNQAQKVMLIGVTYAILDFLEQFPMSFPTLIVLETGGMKGRKKELIKEEVLTTVQKGFSIPSVYSEYGMTELLSQSYAKDNQYQCSPSMKILFRDPQDPFQIQKQQGAINVIDLANIYSCSFIETMDLGKLNEDGSFSLLGRLDHSDIRGCNLMVANI